MTGYGRASGAYGEKTISVEVRSLNSKITDLKLRYPAEYREKEIELRKIVSDHAERGKIDVVIEVQNADGAASVSLNEPLFKGYYKELNRIAHELNIVPGDIMQAVLRIPNVVAATSGEIDEEEWQTVTKVAAQALDALKAFRIQEGAGLELDLRQRVGHIQRMLEEVTPFEKERFARMRERMKTNMEEVFGKDNLDANRFEQEVLYYLEKMDMSEEKQRLAQHCNYFLSQMSLTQSTGRALNFISQEIGREINTLGAKAYDADIQRLVVMMKDELEKIKEQLANVL